MLLNNRYRIDPDSNEISDTLSGATTRLEPRVMQVLDHLVAGNGKLVTREELAQKVWDNYGGADEALTQAVSVLRKALNDEAKDLIRTVPKKGYLFSGKIDAGHAAPPSFPKNKKRDLVRVLIGVLVVLVSLAAFRCLSGNKAEPTTSEPPGSPSEPVADSATIRYERDSIK